MKILLAIMGGFVVSSTVFASGAALAIYLLAAETVNPMKLAGKVGVPWTAEPKVVEKADDEDAIEVASAEKRDIKNRSSLVASAAASEAPQDVDRMQTSAVPRAEPAVERKPDPKLVAKHVAWCDRKYRSYRRSTNSYTPYSGGKRECVSPFTDKIKAQSQQSEVVVVADAGAVAQVSQGVPVQRGRKLTAAHVRSCFDRYRSYRVEDNTYQPYGGGPRRQCR